MAIANLGSLKNLLAICQAMTQRSLSCCAPATSPEACKTQCETLKPDTLQLSSCCKPEPKCC
ncbi:hypothetical protein D3C72_551240 [compost metagenome]